MKLAPVSAATMDGLDYFWYKSNMIGHLSPPAIQSYNLFGESADLPDVVHCETIEARSVLHDWRFETHRHGRLHQIFLIAEGGGEAEMDGRVTAVGPGQFLNVPSGIIHGFTFQPGTVGWVVTIAGEMLDEILAPGEGLLPVLRQPFVGPAAASLYGVVTRIFEEFTRRQFGRAQALRALCGLLTAEIARGIAAERAPPGQMDTSSLMGRFETLLEARFMDHWSVAQYAQALSITPTHLSRVARAATGQPASRLIQDRLVREARRYLVYTGLPISAIAYALGFADPAYFSRLFALVTGRSPRTFRAAL